jgi:hypothetical protein
MALHRDIFWIGRQWAVTGFGMQAINQKYNGQFDIPVERLWDGDLLTGVRGQKWFNPDDFAKALAVAQARHPKPPPKPAAPPLPVETLLQPTNTTTVPEPAAFPATPSVDASALVATQALPESASEKSKPEPRSSEPAPSFPHMRILGHPAKLVRVWRAQRRR